ncbi:MAG: hypothetical protein ABJC12_07270 [Saprospiraceae bacterium]
MTYLVIWTACGSDAIEMFDCSVITPTYNLNIKPILDTSCAKSGCHDAQTNQSGFDLSSYSKAKSLSQQKAFLGSIQQKSSYPAMPNDGVKLSDDKIKLLSCWVQNGSPE